MGSLAQKTNQYTLPYHDIEGHFCGLAVCLLKWSSSWPFDSRSWCHCGSSWRVRGCRGFFHGGTWGWPDPQEVGNWGRKRSEVELRDQNSTWSGTIPAWREDWGWLWRGCTRDLV